MATSVNTLLRDLILRRALRRTKMENACVREVSKEWRRLRADVEALIRSSMIFGGKRARLGTSYQVTIAPLVTDLVRAIGFRLTGIVKCMNDEIPAMARLEFVELPDVIQQTLSQLLARDVTEAVEDEPPQRLSLTFSQVPTQQAAELLATPLGGSMFGQAFADLAGDTLRSLRSALLTGLLQGQSIPKVARAVRGILDNKRYQAERIVRTEYTRVANQAALLTYERNKDVLRGAQWIATLDKRTCVACGFLDGKVWENFDDARMPPLHGNCRCALIPVVKRAKDLGLATRKETTRSAFDGQVAATIKYPAWFKEQTPAFQKEVLGPTRYRLYRDGKAGIKEFTGVYGAKPVRDVLAALAAKGNP